MDMYVNLQWQTEETTPIRRTAVRETGLSRHHGDLIESTIALWGLREALIVPPLCRDTQISRTAEMSFPSVEYQ